MSWGVADIRSPLAKDILDNWDRHSIPGLAEILQKHLVNSSVVEDIVQSFEMLHAKHDPSDSLAGLLGWAWEGTLLMHRAMKADVEKPDPPDH